MSAEPTDIQARPHGPAIQSETAFGGNGHVHGLSADPAGGANGTALADYVSQPNRTRGNVPGRPLFDDVIVGAGFAGSVLAERLAAGAGRRVLVIDRRSHIGGNA